MNRGLARRAVFLGKSEVRYFQARLAREVHRGTVEVHEFCFLTTHFHLLLQSLEGDLSGAMRRVENSFVRWFNRRSKRDGSLFRGRFTSRRVHDLTYRETVRRYIDYNAVRAGMAARPETFPYCSAYVRTRAVEPRWLSSRRSNAVDPPTEHATWVIERRLERGGAADAFDDLVGAAPEAVRKWMDRKARVADGTSARACLVSPAAIAEAVGAEQAAHGSWCVRPGSLERDGWRLLEAGMRYDSAGLSTTEIALDLGMARSATGLAIQQHRRLLIVDPSYRERAANVLRAALRTTFEVGTMEPGSIVR